MKLRGVWRLEHWRNGRLLESVHQENDIVDAGAHSLLNVGFRNQAQIAAWYCGLIDATSFSAISASDTMSSHAGWLECDDYDESARPAWSPDAPSARAISNSTRMVFTINASRTIQGIFLTSGSAKNGTTGTLWSAKEFASPRSVVSGDELRVAYEISVA